MANRPSEIYNVQNRHHRSGLVVRAGHMKMSQTLLDECLFDAVDLAGGKHCPMEPK